MRRINKQFPTMTRRANNTLKLFFCMLVTLVLTGCDLELQDGFEYDSQLEPQFTFGETTAWEWLQTNPQGEFGYMIEAIELTGLEDEFNNASLKRTFFLIKDLGFTHPGGILNQEFENKNTVLADLPDADLIKLKNIMMYYILDTYVDQGPDKLKVLDVDYNFNTLSEDPKNSYMTVRRDWAHTLDINYSTDIKSSTKREGIVRLHNYIFSNGNAVGHMVDRHVRLDKFE